MKKTTVWSIVLLILGTGFLFCREKQEKIGELLWYTEQNSLEEMVAIARRESKPILAVFSATWCKPCQMVKNEVLGKTEFKKVAAEAILLYIEQTDPLGIRYCNENQIRAYPTFKIFSPEGTLLETGQPERTVEGLLEWIKEVKGGNNYYELSQKLEKSPKNRELILKIADRLDPFQADQRIEYLKKAINIKPDPRDPLTQEVYEKLFVYLVHFLQAKRGTDLGKYIEENEAIFQTIIRAYYPDKFRFKMKGNAKFGPIIKWLNAREQYEEAARYFEDFIKNSQEKIDYIKDIEVFYPGFTAYLKLNREKEAARWLVMIHDFARTVSNSPPSRAFIFSYLYLYDLFIRHYCEKGDRAEGEKYAVQYFAEASRLNQEALKEFYTTQYARQYGILTTKAVSLTDQQIQSNPGDHTRLTAKKAVILGKGGQKEAARNLLMQLYEDKEYQEKLDPGFQGQFFNTIAWAMVEAKIVDQKTLEIARKAVDQQRADFTLDTLATVQAELGNFNEALKVEEEALKLAENDYSKQEFKRKIERWKAKRKK